jgi:hypothetical protein
LHQRDAESLQRRIIEERRYVFRVTMCEMEHTRLSCH